MGKTGIPNTNSKEETVELADALIKELYDK